MAVSEHLKKLPRPGWYAAGWRRVVAADPAMRVKDPFDDFGRLISAGELRAKMLKALDKRINTRGGHEAANKAIPIELWRDAWAVNDYRARRVRFYDLGSKIGKKRCGHLVADRGEV